MCLLLTMSFPSDQMELHPSIRRGGVISIGSPYRGYGLPVLVELCYGGAFGRQLENRWVVVHVFYADAMGEMEKMFHFTGYITIFVAIETVTKPLRDLIL